VWANLKGRLRNLAVRGVDQLTAIIKSHLKRMQYRPGLLDGIIAGTGLHLAQPP
jgi:putative transposase